MAENLPMDKPFPSRPRLLGMAAWRLAAGVLFVGLLIFLPAGDLSYWQAWLYLVLLLVPVLIVGSILLFNSPELLERRMRMKESQASQNRVVLISSITMVVLLVVPGLDHRYGWSHVPTLLVLLADFAILAGYGLFGLTLREKSVCLKGRRS